MVVIHKNWQALPVTATSVTAPDPIQQPTDPIQQPTDPIQQPTAGIVELNKINHDKINEPAAYSSCPTQTRPKKRSRIIEQ